MIIYHRPKIKSKRQHRLELASEEVQGRSEVAFTDRQELVENSLM